MKCSKCGFDIPEDSDTCTRCGTPVLKGGYTPTRYIYDDFDKLADLSYAPGDSFGKRYRIAEEIGQGGMGKIYKAWDNELEIHVAIKMIHPELLAKPDTIARFKKEILIAREITHENVVRIYDFGEVEGVKFISMQYIDGENLAELIHSSGTLSIQTAINISKQICQGLKAAHKQDIIHRDLKPQNIMIDKNGKVYITDFGLAKSLEDPGISVSGVVMGTPQYLSPEQAMGEKIDQRSDIYMLGIIMYEMITGKELFVSETVIGYLQKHIQQKPTSPSTINVLIPPFFEKIILKCLEKERSKRYRDVDDLLRDLQKEKVASGPIIFSSRARRILKYFAAALLLILAVTAVYFLVLDTDGGQPLPDSKKSVAVMPFEIETDKKELAHWGETFQDLLITDLYQSRHFSVLSGRSLYDILKELDMLNKSMYTPGELGEIASRGNASHFIEGKLVEMGKVFHCNVKIWDVGSEKEIPLKFDAIEGVENFPRLVDDIGKRIREEFLSADERLTETDKEIGKITIVSPEAYQFYMEGKRYYWDGEYQKSNEVLEKAIRLDPKFAMAYRRIASNYMYLGHFQQGVDNLRKAFEFRNRASERERYLIEVFYYSILKKTPEMAMETCRNLLELYPNDEDGITQLGSIYRQREEWDMAEGLFQGMLKLNNKSQPAFINLVFIHSARGLYNKSKKLLEENKELFLSIKRYHQSMAKIYHYQREYDQAISEIEKAISLYPDNEKNIELKGNIYHTKGDFLEAESAYKKLIGSEEIEYQSKGHSYMSSLYMLVGKYGKSIEEINKGINLCTRAKREEYRPGFLLSLAYIHLRLNNPQAALKAINQTSENSEYFDLVNSFTVRKISLHLKGWYFLKMKRIKEAKDTAEELLRLIIETNDSKKMRLYYHLLGLICLDEDTPMKAIEYFQQARPLLPHQINIWDNRAFYLDPVASAYYKSDNLEKARELYEEIQRLTMGRLKWGDIYARSFYWLGKVYQKLKMQKEAKANYRKFLSLWKDAEQGITEVKDAEKQLELLN